VTETKAEFTYSKLALKSGYPAGWKTHACVLDFLEFPKRQSYKSNTMSRILYVCQEITPYVADSEMATLCRTMSQAMQEAGNEVRTFMPRYGHINERRNQLHEVIRLSGMNLIIDDTDQQLIIKVASIPSARVQIYFIDNDDYFTRKAMLTDDEGVCFDDNDERAIFFSRGVLETVKKLRWGPEIVHCHGWFSAVAPIYLRHVFNDDPLFADVKIAVSLYDDAFPGALDEGFAEKLADEGVNKQTLEKLGEPTYENLMRFVIEHADGVVLAGGERPEGLEAWIEQTGKPVLRCLHTECDNYLEEYKKFYEEIL